MLNRTFFFMASWSQCFHLRFTYLCGSSWEAIISRDIGTGGLQSTSWIGATIVDVYGWEFYAYVNASVYKSQSRWWSETYVINAVMGVLFTCIRVRCFFWMLCRGEVVLYLHYLACVDKELGSVANSVVCFELRQRTIVKVPGVHEVSSHFHCKYTFKGPYGKFWYSCAIILRWFSL